jgi:26S proteasome non-ATPase regulatory subunit 5
MNGNMTVDGYNVVEILEQLSSASEGERTKIIESVRPVLSSLESRTKYKTSIESSDLTIVFDCLNASGKEEVVAASELLDQILEFIDAYLVLIQYKACLKRCIHHPQPQVKVMVMKFLRRCVETERCLEQMFVSDDLLVGATKLIGDEDSNVAKEIKLLLYSMAKLSGTEIINAMPLVQPILPILQELINQEKDATRLRIQELMIMIAKLSPEMTERVSNAGFLQRLCQEVLTHDVLVQLNAIEILSDFAESKHGIIYLEQKGALKDLDNLLNESASSPMASYLLPGFIKFFGRVSRNHPANFTENYPNFTNTVLSLIGNDSNVSTDPGMKKLAIATIGHISTTLKGKVKIASLDGFLHGKDSGPIVKILVSSLKYGSTDDKIVALSACGDILSTPENEQDIHTMSEVSKLFYQSLINAGIKNPMEYFFRIIKQPFAELTESAYNVLINIGNKPWGVSPFIQEPGLVEYILDRNIAIRKEAKELKYDLIKILQTNSVSTDDNIMPPEMLRRFKNYVNDGPFYVEAQAEVALGEA